MSGPVTATDAAPDTAEPGHPEGPTVEPVPSRPARVDPGVLAYLGRGRDELALDIRGGSRVLLLGGRPFS